MLMKGNLGLSKRKSDRKKEEHIGAEDVLFVEGLDKETVHKCDFIGKTEGGYTYNNKTQDSFTERIWKNNLMKYKERHMREEEKNRK